MDGERKRREICIHKMRRSMTIRQIKPGSGFIITIRQRMGMPGLDAHFDGEYYVKELSRSEGFELSVGNKLHAVTNRDRIWRRRSWNREKDMPIFPCRCMGKSRQAMAELRKKFSFGKSQKGHERGSL